MTTTNQDLLVSHRLRPTVRALLVDPDGCVLLFEFLFGSGTLWITPGGGVEPGESELEALRRELREEVGYDLVDVPVLALLAALLRDGPSAAPPTLGR
jgi:8-oxo-dGTP pyrophosphatase MutT (NUDIX family)